ncbi:MAG: right-handed parallel beta-helix repeat-containing protein [bacterium]|uniref:Right-handed parallel beta-helix repeat-containing protein n=1 Tax=Candidatus Aphodosoma intestinipullorum TaxID=2840674 RepID=A0A940DKB4_9BACT|nr:right-handed parallel beta-helix repeat-containing protein [Candidatus Aphodosoma intestinipullorum]
MKLISKILVAVMAAAVLFTSCEPQTITGGGDGSGNGNNNGGNNNGGGTTADGITVWPKDTTVILTDHYLVPEGESLYVEEGATVIASNSEVKPEIVVLGNLYVLGTEANPVTFTVEESSKSDRFSRNWGGIICGYNSEEVVLQNAIIEYGGAQTQESSLSFQHQLFKTETGEGVPGFHFCNPDGQFVITGCTFRNMAEDCIYITGGKSIVMNNRFICNGYDGGEAINYKSDCLVDVAFNFIYDANTNGFKLSNEGFAYVQTVFNGYNNTMVNCGWRRPGVKGGCIWLEAAIIANLYNNLVYDCRWGLKYDIEDDHDESCVLTPNYYFASTQTGVDQMQADAEEGILNSADDIMSATPGDMNPLFVNFTQQDDININVGGNAAGAPVEFNDSWDFHLSAGSPALTGGVTGFTRHFATEGLVFEGLQDRGNDTFTSPDPQPFFGAFGQN